MFNRFRMKKGREYPVKRDARGRSARQRCFELFKDEVPLPDVARTVNVNMATVYKYHQQWKKQPNVEPQLAFARQLFNKNAPHRERTIELLASTVGLEKEELENILQQPHGLRRLVTRKLYLPGNAEADHKRYVALELACLISDHLIKNGGKYEDVYRSLTVLLRQNKLRREVEDRDIEEANNMIALTRRIIEADLNSEKRVPPDRLSREERDAVLKWGIDKAMREAEIAYWLRIGTLMAGGITIEQAHEKIYQDLIDVGDVNGARMVRRFQDKVHPPKADGKSQQASSNRPPRADTE